MRKSLLTAFCTILSLCFLKAQLANFTIDNATGCDSLTVQFTNLTPGINTYFWNFGNDSTSTLTNPVMKFYAGKYRVRLMVNNNPLLTKDTTIIVNPSPKADFQDTMLTYELFRRYFVEKSILQSNIKYTFRFDFDDGSVKTDTMRGAKYPHLFKNQGNYNVSLKVTDPLGCADSVTKLVVIADSSVMIIPNVFTPNRDGINDLFIIRSNGVTELNLQVFNRWGIKVYELTAATLTWDGNTLSGAEAPPGIYYIIVTAKDNVYPETRSSLYLFR